MKPWVSPALFALAWPACAAEAAPVNGSAWGALLQGLFGLLVVLALLYAFLLLLRRFGTGQAGAPGIVRIVGGVMLGPRERLVMVEVRDTWLLVGVASGQVSLVHSMAKPADAAAYPASVPQAAFAERLAGLLRRDGKS